ncbi:hypothetical protein VU13_01395 [Desulfobulbus sp. US5]|nr:hypothetical protein [Desulfobulbus sp. N3]MCW5213971.1 hypothetical protein [Desulfobulbus sp. US5]
MKKNMLIKPLIQSMLVLALPSLLLYLIASNPEATAWSSLGMIVMGGSELYNGLLPWHLPSLSAWPFSLLSFSEQWPCLIGKSPPGCTVISNTPAQPVTATPRSRPWKNREQRILHNMNISAPRRQYIKI